MAKFLGENFVAFIQLSPYFIEFRVILSLQTDLVYVICINYNYVNCDLMLKFESFVIK